MSLLELKDVSIHYITEEATFKAVNNVSLVVEKGETLGLVGETGAGKTTTALGILGLIPNPPGKVVGGELLYDGENLLSKSEKEMRKIRGNEISMIFQDPMTALNPVLPVGEQIAEVIATHSHCSEKEAMADALKMLEMVGIGPERSVEYPHQFSGGMKQRVVIAIALACRPKLLLADEPTTALDVTIQAQVLRMIKDLQQENETAMILITHDLGVVAQTCDKVAIMYAGEIVECGSLYDIFEDVKHPYTIGLFGSIPNLEEDVDRLKPIEGLCPDPSKLPVGCKFSPRCPHCTDICLEAEPELTHVLGNHYVRCHHLGKQEA